MSKPLLGPGVFVAEGSILRGDVELGEGCVVLFQVAIRGDVSSIRIGRRVNIQDGAIIHTESGVPLTIEDDVSIGHRAVVHGRFVGRGSLIGIGSIILDRCEIGRNCLVAAGTVVPPGTIVPDGKVVMGIPGRIVRDVKPEERVYQERVTANYQRLREKYLAGEFPAPSLSYGQTSG